MPERKICILCHPITTLLSAEPVINNFSAGDEGYFVILFHQFLVEQRGHVVWFHFSSLKTWVNYLWMQNLSLQHLNKSSSPAEAIVNKSQTLTDLHLTFPTLDHRIGIQNLNVKYMGFLHYDCRAKLEFRQQQSICHSYLPAYVDSLNKAIEVSAALLFFSVTAR